MEKELRTQKSQAATAKKKHGDEARGTAEPEKTIEHDLKRRETEKQTGKAVPSKAKAEIVAAKRKQK